MPSQIVEKINLPQATVQVGNVLQARTSSLWNLQRESQSVKTIQGALKWLATGMPPTLTTMMTWTIREISHSLSGLTHQYRNLLINTSTIPSMAQQVVQVPSTSPRVPRRVKSGPFRQTLKDNATQLHIDVSRRPIDNYRIQITNNTPEVARPRHST